MNSRPTIFQTLLRCLLLALALALGMTAPAWADPPGRVGRVADFTGEVWLFDSDAQGWEPVERNQPITAGDRLRSGTGARLSLQIGSSSLWLDERSELVFNRLDDGSVQMQLPRGQLALRLRSPDMVDAVLVQTNEGTFKPQVEGLYRVDQLDRGSRVFDWQGLMRFDSRDGNTPPVYLNTGDEAELWWADGPRVERMAIQPDPFADWALAQSNAQDASFANSYISPEMTGAADLSSYGVWQDSPDYGPLWFPQDVGPDWAPYRDGSWAWVAPWGWTWVDAAPWGFAPFHYGRWVMVDGRWCWAPGRREAHPVFAPALVAWVGGGASRRDAPPRYGWYPLAPREVYQPSYARSSAYEARLNVGINITIGGRPTPNRYANMPQAVSTVPGSNWHGHPQAYRPDFGPLHNAPAMPAPQRVDAGRGPRVDAPPPQPNVDGRGFDRDAGAADRVNSGAAWGQAAGAAMPPAARPALPPAARAPTPDFPVAQPPSQQRAREDGATPRPERSQGRGDQRPEAAPPAPQRPQPGPQHGDDDKPRRKPRDPDQQAR